MCLTDKRILFVNEYVKCGFNATLAAERAGYKHPGVAGCKLKKVKEIREEIDKRITEQTLIANEVLYLLSRQAKSSATDYIDEHGIILWDKLRNDGIQVKKVSHQRGKSSSFELYDAQNALQLLGKHYKQFSDRIEHTGKDGGPIEQKHEIDLSKLTDDELEKLESVATSLAR